MNGSSSPHHSRFFYRLFYTPGIFGLVDRVNGALGREGTNAVAETIAHAYILTHPEIVDVTARNIALLGNNLTARKFAAEAFVNFARGLADYWTAGNLDPVDFSKLCDEREGIENLNSVLEEGHGAVLATGHFGQFELGAVLLAEHGIPVTVLTLSEPTPEMTAWRAAFRARWGAETIEIGMDAFHSIEAVRAISKGRFCAMLVDRPYRGEALPVDLPGGPIAFSTSAALLALLGNCPILPVAIHRKNDGRYRMVARRPVRIDRSIPRKDAIEKATRETAAELIPEFIRHPEHWFHFVPLTTGIQ